MIQKTIYDYLNPEHIEQAQEGLDSLMSSLGYSKVDDTEPKTVEDLDASIGDVEEPTQEEGIRMSKRQAILHSIDDVVLNTLQSKRPIELKTAQTLITLGQLRTQYLG